MQTKKLKYLLLVAAVAITALLVWYFTYWVKTPQYTLGFIGTAVQKHDFAAFEKHVDMESLYGNAYDDVVAASFGSKADEQPYSSGAGTKHQRHCCADIDRPNQKLCGQRNYGRS